MAGSDAAVRCAPRGRPGKALDVEDIGRRHAAGETISRIATTLHVHKDRIYSALEEAGVSVRLGAWGPHHPRWSGGRCVTGAGYVRITLDRDDPYRELADARGTVFEHRYVMAQALGRPLRATETVHHIDGNKGNNALDNLQLRFGDHGEGIVLICVDCGSHNIRPEEL